MKKALMICILAALLTSCGIGRTNDNTETKAVSQTAEQTLTEARSAAISAKEENDISSGSSICTTVSETQSRSGSLTKAVTAQTACETKKADTSHTTVNSSVRHEPASTTLTSESVTEIRQTVTSANTTRASERTSAATATKPKAVTTVKTTAKTKAVPSQTQTSVSEEIIYVEIENATCLESMVENLEMSDTPPSYYEKIGRGLANDGTDYGKAKAVYKWMLANGWGSCVYYSMETYFLCKGIGLECAYAFMTDNDWYGHTYSVVKVDGVWYVMDTQGGIFLDNTNYCTRMFDGNDNDITPFKEDIWYDYDENGEYRGWTLE